MVAVTVLTDRFGLRVAGEVDVTSLAVLSRALASLPAPARGEIHLELAGLEFIDVAGARELMSLAQSGPATRLVLHDPPPVLRRLLALLWPGIAAEIVVGQDRLAGPRSD